MNAHTEDQDKSEPASQHKLEQARQRGSTARSAELPVACMLLALLAFLGLASAESAARLASICESLLAGAADVNLASPHLPAWLVWLTRQAMAACLPLLILALLSPLAAKLLQSPPGFTLFPLKPDLKRLDPLAGMKRLFGHRLLAELLKSSAKLIAIGAATLFALAGVLPHLLALPALTPAALAVRINDEAFRLVAFCLVAFIPVLLFDLLWSRRAFAKQMRMSRRELKDEHRQREGDPRIRARRRQLQRETMKRNQSLNRVAAADLVVTNPVRLAVALRYDPLQMDAPAVWAKGAGAQAARMRMLALRHGVPVIAHRDLARQLYRATPVDGTIPESAFADTARLFNLVRAARAERAAQAASIASGQSE